MEIVEFFADGTNVYQFMTNGEEQLIIRCETESVATQTATDLNAKLQEKD